MTSDITLDVESLRAEIISEMEVATSLRTRLAALLHKLDILDKRYSDKVAALSATIVQQDHVIDQLQQRILILEARNA